MASASHFVGPFRLSVGDPAVGGARFPNPLALGSAPAPPAVFPNPLALGSAPVPPAVFRNPLFLGPAPRSPAVFRNPQWLRPMVSVPPGLPGPDRVSRRNASVRALGMPESHLMKTGGQGMSVQFTRGARCLEWVDSVKSPKAPKLPERLPSVDPRGLDGKRRRGLR